MMLCRLHFYAYHSVRNMRIMALVKLYAIVENVTIDKTRLPPQVSELTIKPVEKLQSSPAGHAHSPPVSLPASAHDS